jgi:hypothetical protein
MVASRGSGVPKVRQITISKGSLSRRILAPGWWYAFSIHPDESHGAQRRGGMDPGQEDEQ